MAFLDANGYTICFNCWLPLALSGYHSSRAGMHGLPLCGCDSPSHCDDSLVYISNNPVLLAAMFCNIVKYVDAESMGTIKVNKCELLVNDWHYQTEQLTV
jgi:hypothetical protein